MLYGKYVVHTLESVGIVAIDLSMAKAYISIATRLGHPDHLCQPSHVLPGLTRSNPLIKHPGLTWILHRITCVNNDILQ